MMEDDDVKRRPELAIGQSLDHLSVGELKEYIAVLKAEIVRAEEAIKAREDVRGAAEALFKPRS